MGGGSCVGEVVQGRIFRANCLGVKAREKLSRGCLSIGDYSEVIVRGRSPGLIVLREISWGGGELSGGQLSSGGFH